MRRAGEGTLEPVYYGGRPVGAIRRYSDTMLIFLLKAAKPEKYRDGYSEFVDTPRTTCEVLINKIHKKLARVLAHTEGADKSDPSPAPST